jgi:hypothetical protein
MEESGDGIVSKDTDKEMYRLSIAGTHITIEATHDRGLLSGVYELEQILLSLNYSGTPLAHKPYYYCLFGPFHYSGTN